MHRERWRGPVVVTCALGLASAAACGSTSSNAPGGAGSSGAGTTAGSASGGGGAAGAGVVASGGPTATGGDAGNAGATESAAGEDGAGGAPEPEILTCAATANRVGAVGCEFWPTFVANPVWTTFSPGLALANEGIAPSEVTIDGPAGFHRVLTLEPSQSTTIELPWAAELKGPEWSRTNTSGARTLPSTRVTGGAYRVTSSLPIAVWQFNPLRPTQSGDGCPQGASPCRAGAVDGTALLPTSALTGNYRVLGYSARNGGTDWGSVPSGIAITATQDGTQLAILAGPRCGTELVGTSQLGPCTVAGGGISALTASSGVRISLDAGDVLQLMAATAAAPALKNADLSGTLLEASAPVQVVAFNSVANVPDESVGYTDHLEELLPASEFLSKRYVVVPPTTPLGTAGSHVVRLFGHIDGTVLTYPIGKPAGAPDVLNAGDVAQLPTPSSAIPTPDCIGTPGQCVTTTPFIVEGTQAFGVASYSPGSILQLPGADASTTRGDPAATFVTPTDQYDERCSLFIPEGYSEAFVDVVAPLGATVLLDGVAPAAPATTIGQSEWSLWRLPVTASGWHGLETDHAGGMSAQVSAFAPATSLYYAACARGRLLTQPPVVILP